MEYERVFLLTGLTQLTGLLPRRLDCQCALWARLAVFGGICDEKGVESSDYGAKVPTQQNTTSQRVARKISGGRTQTGSTCITNYK